MCGSRDAEKVYRRHLEVGSTLAQSWGPDEKENPLGRLRRAGLRKSETGSQKEACQGECQGLAAPQLGAWKIGPVVTEIRSITLGHDSPCV